MLADIIYGSRCDKSNPTEARKRLTTLCPTTIPQVTCSASSRSQFISTAKTPLWGCLNIS